MITIPFCLPDDITPARFLEEYWQKKPLLIKQGLPQLASMFEPEDIIGLSLDEVATARLLTQTPINSVHSLNSPNNLENSENFDNGKNNDRKDQVKWHLQQSPLTEAMFEDLPEQWTVLVQNLEQWSPEVGELWHAFDFIPQWQRDDIMVSYAPKGGSVGKHYDDYDVFLAQGYGSRRWQLGKYCDETTAFLPNQPIRIFDDLGDIIFDEVLEAGDVLYVPPKLAHYGVAEEDCLTFSFGFRRPNLMQVLDSLVDTATAEPSLFVPLTLEQSLQSSGKLDSKSIVQIKAQLLDMLQSDRGDSLIQQAVAEVVSKREYEVLIPEETLSLPELEQALIEGASLKPDYSSRLIYTEQDGQFKVYANGQPLEELDSFESKLLIHLANGQSLAKEDLLNNKNIALDKIMSWLENGWVWLDLDPATF